MKTLRVAESAGFCPGVARSVALAEKALKEYGVVWCLGELVHNRDETARLEALGMRTVHRPEEIPEGAVALLRAHGEGPEVYDILAARGVRVVDTTCGKVKLVHDLARSAAVRGRTLAVLGDPEHPEVQGVLAWAGRGFAAKDPETLEKFLCEDPILVQDGVDLVFQTTETEKNFKKSQKIAKKWCTNCEIFDTICVATQIRQSEAVELAKICDAMVVVGGKHSANSRHLARLCQEILGEDRVLFVENASTLDLSLLSGCGVIGLTAGASVPERILKEVEQKMDEIRETVEATPEEISAPAESAMQEPTKEAGDDREQSFEEMVGEFLPTINNGDVVKGVVVEIKGGEVMVDLGAKHSGYIPVEEFENDSSDAGEQIHVGDTVQATVVHVNENEGIAKLSKKRLDAAKNWESIESAFENETVVEGTVTEENKGGVVVKVHGVRVFVPASQSGLPRDAEMSQLLHQKVQLYITEVNRARHNRVVGSIRKVAAKARRENIARIWDEIEIGKRYKGVVKSLTSYGAFVDIGGVDGMVHVSELSWKRINKPSEVVAEGDEIEVYVIGFDRETRKISLGYKDPSQNPWLQFTSQYQVGDVATVRIVKLMTFGAFAEIVPGVDGLIHISQIANHRITKPDEVLHVGDEVDAKITAINEEKQRISLSIRALSEPAPGPRKNSYREEEEPEDDEAELGENGGGDALVYEVSETGVSTGNIPEDVGDD